MFQSIRIDPQRIAVGGFSAGASYALSIGLANGGLFTHVSAYSPGFNAAPAREGRPRVFVSHGTSDGVLPINATSRRIVPQLRREGYEVEYEEFTGLHTVPSAIVEKSLDWFL